MAVATIAANSVYVKPFLSGTKNFFRNYTDLVFFGAQSTRFAEELHKSIHGTKNIETKKYDGRNGYNGLGEQVKKSWATAKNAVKDKSLWQMLTSSGKENTGEVKEATNAIKIAGKEIKVPGILKSIVDSPIAKAIGKKAPLLLNFYFLYQDVPNICKAFTDTKNGGGVVAGLAETSKEAIKLGALGAGAVIGQALIPIPWLGGLIGGWVGSLIAEQIVGKSFTENAEEKETAEAKTANAATAENSNTTGQSQAQLQQGGNQNGLYLPTITGADMMTYGQKYSSNPFTSSSF